MKHSYDVILETSVGKRHGKMDVFIDNTKISGALRILKGEEAFCGEISHDGHCSISGNLATLMHNIPYTGTGTIGEHIDLCLNSAKDCFRLVGKLCV